MDIHKQDFLADATFFNFITKNKCDGKTKIVKYEYVNKLIDQKIVQNYYCLFNNDDTKNPKSIWKFNDKIITLKFRLKFTNTINKKYLEIYENNNHLAISFAGGRLKIFHYETKSLISEFKSNYGNIISLEYSLDGKVLGLGCEDDNVYIIDAELNTLLYCLDGHKNYITSIIFEEQLVGDDETIDKSQMNSIEGIYDKLETYKSEKGIFNSNQTTTKINPVNNKEISLDDLTQIVNEIDEVINIDIRRSRTSINPNIPIQGFRLSTTYDVYTASLDGHLGIWRIEYFYDEGIINEKNYNFINIQSLNNREVSLIKLEQPKIEYLSNIENNKIYFTNMVKIKNAQLNYLTMIDNILIYISKRNSLGSSLYLCIYHGVIQVEEEISKTEVISQNVDESQSIERRHSGLDTKYEKLKKLSANAKGNNIDYQTMPYSDSMNKSRKTTSMSPGKDRRVATSGSSVQSTSNSLPTENGKIKTNSQTMKRPRGQSVNNKSMFK